MTAPAADELAQGDVPDGQLLTRDTTSPPAQNYSEKLSIDTTTDECADVRLRQRQQPSPIKGNTSV